MRRLLGLEFEGAHLRAGLADRRRARTCRTRSTTVEFICDPRRPTPHMVAPGGRQRWEFMLKPGERPRGDGAAASRCAGCSRPGATSTQIRIERNAVYRFQARVARSFSQGPLLPRRRRRARHAAVRGPGSGGGTARCREPRVEARLGRSRPGRRADPRQLRRGAPPARAEDDQPGALSRRAGDAAATVPRRSSCTA